MQLCLKKRLTYLSAVHCHMTNTHISDVEILEKRYPIILREFSVRGKSGGQRQYKGGEGVKRIIECRDPFTLLQDIRPSSDATIGLERRREWKLWRKPHHARKLNDGNQRVLGPRGLVKLKAGDQFIIKTPGGGDWGRRSMNGVHKPFNALLKVNGH
ncbi:unnamed protein product [Clonostachys rhizophaga]|uniref:Hydantoinase B/oxoprolinase domain-containing protein n=1 Tax=Clonostachys rhizophaga TaxID=160324 RepID=A0A9N9VVD1_9HYPO|nr:unnamed protein product [Clonostachys rhizophaga]